GIDVTFVDATDVARVEEALRPETRLVVVETIANPATQVADLARIGALCQAKGILYVVDNTLTSPYLFLPKSVKASLSINSLSKYFGGHGNALGGSGALFQAKGILYVADNTLTYPYLFLPKSVNASLSINSLSIYVGGHGNALGASVTDTGLFGWSAYPNILDIYKTPGAVPDKSALLQLRKKGLRDFGGTLAPEAR